MTKKTINKSTILRELGSISRLLIRYAVANDKSSLITLSQNIQLLCENIRDMDIIDNQ